MPSRSKSPLIEHHLEARAEENTARHAGDPDYFVTLLDPHSIRIRADRIALLRVACASNMRFKSVMDV